MTDVKVIQPTQKPPPKANPRLAITTYSPVTDDDLQVYVHKPTLAEIIRYSKSETHRELGGVLLGGYHVHDGREYIVIDAYVPAKMGESATASFKFTHDSWSHITRVWERDYPSKKMVGWHHTHPRFGIFLSSMDEFIHKGYFDLPWQVAMVVDPVNDTLGFFQWKNSRTVKRGFHVYIDAGQSHSNGRPAHTD